MRFVCNCRARSRFIIHNCDRARSRFVIHNYDRARSRFVIHNYDRARSRFIIHNYDRARSRSVIYNYDRSRCWSRSMVYHDRARSRFRRRSRTVRMVMMHFRRRSRWRHDMNLFRREKYVIKITEENIYSVRIFPVIDNSARNVGAVTGAACKHTTQYRRNKIFY